MKISDTDKNKALKTIIEDKYISLRKHYSSSDYILTADAGLRDPYTCIKICYGNVLHQINEISLEMEHEKFKKKILSGLSTLMEQYECDDDLDPDGWLTATITEFIQSIHVEI
ncbi:hypothetical protein [Desulfobacula toluolica]|uniref:hypothetical protein n=1 Tax=Desulfobacula toluolica TaxID=28223 RepID=UPI00059BCF22|nr:hypothetical protein [Desulfobacula toluolica]